MGRISPHVPTPPGSKAMAPLTSTPLTAQGPGSSGTPWSLRGLVNLECVGLVEVVCSYGQTCSLLTDTVESDPYSLLYP